MGYKRIYICSLFNDAAYNLYYKGNVAPVHYTMKAYGGVTSALVGGEWSVSPPVPIG
jgi:hypothetical protein